MKQITLKFVLAMSLLAASAAASADRPRHCEDLRHGPQSGCWRQGDGHRDRYSIYYQENNHWRRAPGSATDVGNGWVIGTDRRDGGYGIYRWTGYGWRRVPGAAIAIGGPFDRPWVINDRNERFVWNGRDWDHDRGHRSSGARDNRHDSYRDQRRHGDDGRRRHNR